MNYSFMSFSCPDLTLDEMLSLAKTLGYNAIEPRSVSNHAHGVELETDAEQRAVIKEKAANSGIALCCAATSCRYADPATVAVNSPWLASTFFWHRRAYGPPHATLG